MVYLRRFGASGDDEDFLSKRPRASFTPLPSTELKIETAVLKHHVEVAKAQRKAEMKAVGDGGQ